MYKCNFLKPIAVIAGLLVLFTRYVRNISSFSSCSMLRSFKHKVNGGRVTIDKGENVANDSNWVLAHEQKLQLMGWVLKQRNGLLQCLSLVDFSSKAFDKSR